MTAFCCFHGLSGQFVCICSDEDDGGDDDDDHDHDDYVDSEHPCLTYVK